MEDNQRSIAGFGSNFSNGSLSEFRRSKSSNDSLDKSERLLTLMILSSENILSSLPFHAGSEKRSFANASAFVHSEEQRA